MDTAFTVYVAETGNNRVLTLAAGSAAYQQLIDDYRDDPNLREQVDLATVALYELGALETRIEQDWRGDPPPGPVPDRTRLSEQPSTSSR